MAREQKAMKMRVNQRAPLRLMCVHTFSSTRASALHIGFSSPLKTRELKLHLLHWSSKPLFTDLCLTCHLLHYFIHPSVGFLKHNLYWNIFFLRSITCYRDNILKVIYIYTHIYTYTRTHLFSSLISSKDIKYIQQWSTIQKRLLSQ